MDLIKMLTVLLFAAGLAACNTMEGAGEDIEAGGETVSETARDVEDEID
jgi:entericidin B